MDAGRLLRIPPVRVPRVTRCHEWHRSLHVRRDSDRSNCSSRPTAAVTWVRYRLIAACTEGSVAWSGSARSRFTESTRPGHLRAGGPRAVALLLGAGFGDPRLEEVEVIWRFERFDDYWRYLTELATAMHDYIEIWHNTRRRHSALNMLTPTEFEHQHQQQRTAA
jgi:transposase InsO family protein